MPSLALFIAVGASIIENGSNFNGVNIKSLDYSAVQPHSRFTYDSESGMGIKYNGVSLVCSKSIDYIAYPAHRTEQRGGTLIIILGNRCAVTLFKNSDFVVTTQP